MILHKFKIWRLKHKLKIMNRNAKCYRNNESIGDVNWYDTIGIPLLEKDIFEKEHPNQHLFVYCPNCGNELSSSNSFVKDDENGVEYICSKCETETLWDFDMFCPILMSVDNKIYDEVNYKYEKAVRLDK